MEESQKRGKEPSGSIVKRGAPLEHTAASLAAFDYLVGLWGMTHQATIRRALEMVASAEYWPGISPTLDAEEKR